MTGAKERWQDVPGYGGAYQASDRGRLRRVWKTKATVLKAIQRKDGYRDYELYGPVRGPAAQPQDENKKGKKGRAHAKAHRLIWLTFKGPIPEGVVLNHIDGKRNNNWLTNLECCTQKENAAHAKAMGLRKMRLPLKAQQAIIADAPNKTASELAEEWNVSDSYIRTLTRGATKPARNLIAPSEYPTITRLCKEIGAQATADQYGVKKCRIYQIARPSGRSLNRRQKDWGAILKDARLRDLDIGAVGKEQGYSVGYVRARTVVHGVVLPEPGQRVVHVSAPLEMAA